MCGFVGYFCPKTAQPETVDIAAMLATLRHRGPDGVGIHTSEDRRFAAGFARLAIIDPTLSDQPLVVDGGRRVMMGNGEVYNYRELREELSRQGQIFTTNGDMEPAMKLWTSQGESFVDHLNGMYALALYDRDEHSLLLVRDRLGIKPLYYALTPTGGIVFASEIKALFASGLVSPRVDEAAVSVWLSHGYVPAPTTLYAGVRKLPQGHLLRVSSDASLHPRRYWRASLVDLPQSPEDVVGHMRDLLKNSIRLQLRSDVPVAALLSGGIDSGLIVALAAEQLEHPLQTYTVRFAGAPVDESPLAQAVASRYGTNHTLLHLSTDEAAQHLPKLAWYADEPLADASLLPNFLINQMLSKQTRVVLNGSGGDELFAGYGRYFPLPVEQRYLTAPQPLRRLARGMITPFNPMTAWRLSRAEQYLTDGGRYLRDHCTQFPPPMLHLMGHRITEVAACQSAYVPEWTGDAQGKALYADLNTYLPEDLLTLLDRTTMAVSVEGRVPFLDHRLVEAALSVPATIRTPGGRQKHLERLIANPYLPQEVLNAPKQGFASPVPAWFQGALASQVRQLLTSRRTLQRGWWHKDGIERLLRHPQRHAFRLYALTMLELTVRLHVDSVTTVAPTDGLEAFLDD